MRYLLLLLLTGCATASVCPPIKDYTPEFQSRLASEIEAMPDDSATVQAIIDYGALRAMVRACQ